MLKLLIVEGNVKELREKAANSGLLTQSDLYRNVLNSLADNLICTVVFPADEDAVLPGPERLTEYDGIVWTGSALNIYDRGPAIERQIDFMKLCMSRKTRIFGSCWGLQVAVVAAGGEVAANPKGREIGVARDIRVTGDGLSHPLYSGKPPKFDAVAIHLDHTVRLPSGSTVLAGNDISKVQAVEIKCGQSVFWGVQYHPEFDLEYIASLIRRYGPALIDEGIRENDAEVEKWASDLAAAQRGEGGQELRRSYGLGGDVLDSGCRLLELSNWLSYLPQAIAEAGTNN